MARLAVSGVLLLWLASCATSPLSNVSQTPSPPVQTVEVASEAPWAPEPAAVPLLSPPVALGLTEGAQEWVRPLWDAEELTFGWIDLPRWGQRLGVTSRFWTENRELWKKIRLMDVLGSDALVPLMDVYRSRAGERERFWAAYGIYRLYRDAGLEPQSRLWRERVLSLEALPLLTLEQVWDLTFQRNDPDSARKLWKSIAMQAWPDSRDASRARLVRNKLFSGELNLTPLGLDTYVSSLAVDRDDLWVGTWNGALARVSLATGEWTVLAKPAVQIAPIRLLRVNRFFVYVFREFGFSRYSKVTGGWRELSYPPGWSGLRIQDVLLTADEDLWLAHLGQGLWSWKAGVWQSHGEGAPSAFLNAVSPGPDGSFLIGTQDQGLWRWWHDTWDRVRPPSGRSPDNISVIVRSPVDADRRWAIGTYGQGLWMTDGFTLSALSTEGEFVTAVEWSGATPWWAVLDRGLWHGDKKPWEVLGLREGLVDPGATSLVVHGGRLFWGTTGRSVQFWSEDDDPLVYR